jgi:hypothetical protein
MLRTNIWSFGLWAKRLFTENEQLIQNFYIIIPYISIYIITIIDNPIIKKLDYLCNIKPINIQHNRLLVVWMNIIKNADIFKITELS